MKWQEIAVSATEDTTDSVTNIFYDLGAQGVVIEDPRDIAKYLELHAWDAYEFPPEVLEAETVVVKAYLPFDPYLNDKLAKLEQALAGLKEHFATFLPEMTLAEVEEADWANAWKAFYVPVKVGEKMVIVPSWEKYESRDDQVLIFLDPGMAFGTGNHPTTCLCLKALEKYLLPGQTVIDVGCGSGILSIAAAKLGARKVIALDLDPVALKVCQENAEKNRVSGLVSIVHSNLLEAEQGPADLVVANLTADPVIALAPQAANILSRGNYFLSSGISSGRLEDTQKAIRAAGFEIAEVWEESGWCLVAARKNA